MSEGLRVEIDTAICTGHGRCYELAPSVFTDDERGYGQVRNAVLLPELVSNARSAEANCPERAIRIKGASSCNK